MRRLACGLAWVPCLVLGCFTDQSPMVGGDDDDGGSTSTTSVGSTTAPTTSTTAGPTTTTAPTVGSTGVPPTSGSPTSSGTGTGATTGPDTGGVAGCSCPDGAWVCSDFEDDAVQPPWVPENASPPVIDDLLPTPCGQNSLRAEIEGTDLSSLASANLAAGTVNTPVFRIHFLAYVGDDCFATSGVRLFEFEGVDQGAGEFRTSLYMRPSGIELRLLDAPSDSHQAQGLADTWFSYELIVDTTSSTPTITLLFEGTNVAMGTVENPLTFTGNTVLTLGPFNGDVAFDSGCTMYFDNVWIAPDPMM